MKPINPINGGLLEALRHISCYCYYGPRKGTYIGGDLIFECGRCRALQTYNPSHLDAVKRVLRAVYIQETEVKDFVKALPPEIVEWVMEDE